MTLSLACASLGGAMLSAGNAGAAVPDPPTPQPPLPTITPPTSQASIPTPDKVTFTLKTGALNADGTKGPATTSASVSKPYAPGTKVHSQATDPSLPVTSAGVAGNLPGSPSWTGCGWIEQGVYLDSDIFRTRLFEYSVTTRWCWGFNQGAREVTGANGPGTDPQWSDNPHPTFVNWSTGEYVQSDHFFYAAWAKNGVPLGRSGHQDYVKRRFNQTCAPIPGCTNREAWVRNIAFADGSYWWDAGID
jgi:hypothetical protein